MSEFSPCDGRGAHITLRQDLGSDAGRFDVLYSEQSVLHIPVCSTSKLEFEVLPRYKAFFAKPYYSADPPLHENPGDPGHDPGAS